MALPISNSRRFRKSRDLGTAGARQTRVPRAPRRREPGPWWRPHRPAQGPRSPGREQASAVSSTLIWEGPSSPMENAAVGAHHLEVHVGVGRADAKLLEALVITKAEKLDTKGILPAYARPAPMPTILDSAMPQEMKRSGTPWRNRWSWWNARGPRRIRRCRGSRGPSSASARPNASRVAAPSLSSNLVCTGITAAPVSASSTSAGVGAVRETWGYSP